MDALPQMSCNSDDRRPSPAVHALVPKCATADGRLLRMTRHGARPLIRHSSAQHAASAVFALILILLRRLVDVGVLELATGITYLASWNEAYRFDIGIHSRAIRG